MSKFAELADVVVDQGLFLCAGPFFELEFSGHRISLGVVIFRVDQGYGATMSGVLSSFARIVSL